MVRGFIDPARLKFAITALTLLIIVQCQPVKCQEKVWNYFYRIHFTDKGDNDVSGFSPEDLLSERATERRRKAGIAVPDYRDLPVWKDYTDQIEMTGLTLHCTSKWLNTALFKSSVPADPGMLDQFPFIKDVKIVRSPVSKGFTHDKSEDDLSSRDLPPYNNSLSMINGLRVLSSGLTGEGVLIAVIDGGFTNADLIPSLDNLRNRNGIKGTYDFADRDEFVYDYNDHGTAVMSVLAGMLPGAIEGSAPGADYLLLRSEITESEYPAEEDLWTAAAEFADSIGADIISSSLGYCTFDDPLMDYSFSDMDGDKAFVTKAADIAASKGILVVNSAGNERKTPWVRIIAPSDGDSVLAVGAVDGDRIISSFSSAGPGSDRQVKPDIVSQGVSVPVQVSPAMISRASGTSFSCPLISGMCACIMQAVPQATNFEIISALQSASDRHLTPDSLYGFGIPDIEKTIAILQEKHVPKPASGIVVFPNPFRNKLFINFSAIPEKLTLELFDQSGRLLMKRKYSDFVSRSLTLDDLPVPGKGVYFVRFITQDETYIHKIIKVEDPR